MMYQINTFKWKKVAHKEKNLGGGSYSEWDNKLLFNLIFMENNCFKLNISNHYCFGFFLGKF